MGYLGSTRLMGKLIYGNHLGEWVEALTGIYVLVALSTHPLVHQILN